MSRAGGTRSTPTPGVAPIFRSLSPGGCWCEKLQNGGFVKHLEVVLAIPEKTLRLAGRLGPLQAIGATGALTFSLRSASPTSTKVAAEYSVVGYSADGL